MSGRPRSDSLRAPLITAFLLAGMIPLLLAVGLVTVRNARGVEADNRAAAQSAASDLADRTTQTFREWRGELLVAARNDALREWYTKPRLRGELRANINASLVGIHSLFPALIDEACYIDAKGPEQARQVRGRTAPISELSPDESGNPFFDPTFALPEGRVHQHEPYVSPDSNSWVISNSTPIVVGGRKVAILHFETELSAMRTELIGYLPKHSVLRIIDPALGEVIMDSRYVVPPIDMTKPLTAQPLPKITPLRAPSGSMLAEAKIDGGTDNQNRWVVQLIEPANPTLTGTLIAQLTGLAAVVIALLTALAFVVTRWLVIPLRAVTAQAVAMAAGDLTGRVRLTRHDEIGQLGAAVDRAAEKLSATVNSVRGESQSLLNAAQHLNGVSEGLTAQSSTTAVESDRMSTTAGEASAAVDVLTSGVGTLDAAVGQIADRAGSAGRIAADGARIADETTVLVAGLVEASGTIDEVVRVIGAVTDQTRLLALNATIEAARAGEHGRGFAVVATEVKQLAEETSAATSQISSRVEALRSSAGAAADAIGRIARVITEVHEAHSAIAEAVEEQTRVAAGMGAEVQALSSSVTSVADGSDRVVAAVTGTQLTARETADAAAGMTDAAERLRQVVSDFSVEP